MTRAALISSAASRLCCWKRGAKRPWGKKEGNRRETGPGIGYNESSPVGPTLLSGPRCDKSVAPAQRREKLKPSVPNYARPTHSDQRRPTDRDQKGFDDHRPQERLRLASAAQGGLQV